MRTIKFRAWNGTEMIYDVVCGAGIWGIKDQFYSIVDIDKNPKEHIKIMQYTGLKDKNGVEIYEGDIVEFIGHKNRVIEWTPEKNHYSGWYATGDIRPLPLYSGQEPNTIEVIGNIYENPELIK